MSFIDRFVLKLYGILLLVLSFLCVLFHCKFLSVEVAKEYFAHFPLMNVDYFILFCGGLFFFMALSLLNLSRPHLRRRKMASFRTEKGSVVVRVSAIEEYLSKTIQTMEQVHRSVNRIFFKKKRLIVVCSLTLNTKNTVENFTEILQKEIKRQLSTVIGFSIPFSVKIRIVKILVSPQENPINNVQHLTADDSSETSFKGIKY